FVTSDIYVTLVFLYCRVVVTELDQHQIIWLQRAIDFIPAALFEEGAGAAAAFGFVNHLSCVCLDQMAQGFQIGATDKWLEFLAPASHRMAFGPVIVIKG